MESFISDDFLVEGLSASICFPFIIIYIQGLFTTYIYSAVASWISIWLIRKFAITFYKSLKVNLGIHGFNFYIYPKLGIKRYQYQEQLIQDPTIKDEEVNLLLTKNR